MTKTPIQKMIEKLEAVNKVLVGLTGEYTTLKDVRAFMAELVKTAHVYAAEEQSQKPASPADLLAELESLAGDDNAYYMTMNGYMHKEQAYVNRKSLQEIIARYRPH